jgi:hypothetical protein
MCIGADDVTQQVRTAPESEATEGLTIQQAEKDRLQGNFYKSPDVKSRVAWTLERRRLLEEMWNSGAKAPAIAAVLGCKVGAINVARARFGLKPRRAASGRSKQEPDEPPHKIERVAFATSRLADYCNEKELVAQTGHESHHWPRVITKELVDNGLDECEEAEVAPVLEVTITTGKHGKPTRIVVEDNGRGIPSTTVSGIINYAIRISSREAYISPTRGRQGNALKTILPMSFIVGGKVKGETWIEARGVKHRLVFSVNQIRQEPFVKDIRSRSRMRTGTRVTVFWPHDHQVDSVEIAQLLKAYIWCNPHLTLRFHADGKEIIRYDATNPNWTKYRACDATSAHWYTLEQFERYAGALIEKYGGRYTVREFAAQFRGMSAETEAGRAHSRRFAHGTAWLLRL